MSMSLMSFSLRRRSLVLLALDATLFYGSVSQGLETTEFTNPIFTITAEIHTRAHWLIFMVNMRTET